MDLSPSPTIYLQEYWIVYRIFQHIRQVKYVIGNGPP